MLLRCPPGEKDDCSSFNQRSLIALIRRLAGAAFFFSLISLTPASVVRRRPEMLAAVGCDFELWNIATDSILSVD